MDKRYIDRNILHKQYGKGVITDIDNDDITVEFASQNMIFKFPDAFLEGALIADDADLRSYVQRSLLLR